MAKNQHSNPVFDFPVEEMIGKPRDVGSSQSFGNWMEVFRTAPCAVNHIKKGFKEAVSDHFTRFVVVESQDFVHVALDQMLENQRRFHQRPRALRN